MDNWFFTLPLLTKSKTMGILSVFTFYSNRLGGCPLMSEKSLKKWGHGSFDCREDFNTRTHLLKWFENKCVAVGSSIAGVECFITVERYDLAQTKVKIYCPDMVSQYNHSMDRVDLANALIVLYRTNIITRKRWYLKLIFHCVDVVRANAWLLCHIVDKRKSQRNCRLTWESSQQKLLLHLP